MNAIVDTLHNILLNKKGLVKHVCSIITDHVKESKAAAKKLISAYELMSSDSCYISCSDIEVAYEYASNFFEKICCSRRKDAKYPYIEHIVSYFKMMLRTPNVDTKFREHALKVLKISSNSYHGDIRKSIAYFQRVCDYDSVSDLRNLFICEIATKIQLLSAQVVQDVKLKDREKHALTSLFDEILLALEQMRMTISFKEDAFESQKIYESIDKIQRYKQTKQTFYPDALDRIISSLNTLLSSNFSSRDLKLFHIIPHLERYYFHTGMQRVLTLISPPSLEQLKLICINLLMIGMKLHMDDGIRNYRSIVANMKSFAIYSEVDKTRIVSDLVYNEAYLFSILCGNRESNSFVVEKPSPTNYVLRKMCLF